MQNQYLSTATSYIKSLAKFKTDFAWKFNLLEFAYSTIITSSIFLLPNLWYILDINSDCRNVFFDSIKPVSISQTIT